MRVDEKKELDGNRSQSGERKEYRMQGEPPQYERQRVIAPKNTFVHYIWAVYKVIRLLGCGIILSVVLILFFFVGKAPMEDILLAGALIPIGFRLIYASIARLLYAIFGDGFNLWRSNWSHRYAAYLPSRIDVGIERFGRLVGAVMWALCVWLLLIRFYGQNSRARLRHELLTSPSEESPLEIAQLILAYVQTLVWPLVTLCVLWWYRSAILSLLAQSKLKFTFAGVTIESTVAQL